MTTLSNCVQCGIAATILSLTLSQTAHAQKLDTLPDTVVSANLLEQKVEDAIPVTVLIKREDIERSAAVDLPTLLRQYAGIEVTQNGGLGTNSSAFIRGAESRHTMIIVDGMPINNLNFNVSPLEAIPLFGVERIEVVRGNVSALYGSSAMGGVIQIFTRKDLPKDWAEYRVQAGQYQMFGGSLNAGKALEQGLRLQAGVERLRNSGYSAIRQDKRPGTNADRDGAERNVYQAQISQDKDALKWRLAFSETRLFSQYDSEYGPSSQADESKYKLRNLYFGSNYDVTGQTQVQMGIGRYTDQLNADVTQYPYSVTSLKDQWRLGVTHHVSKNQTMTFGVENTLQTIQSPTTQYAQTSRRDTAYRFGYQINSERHVIQLNIRRDSFQRFEAADTYYLGYQFIAADQWRVIANQSTGFMAPTFNDLYYPNEGNPNLKPESLKSHELGFQWGDANQTLRAVVFRNRYNNLIDYNTNYTSRVNIGSATNLGQEVTYNLKRASGSLRLTWLAQSPRNDLTGESLLKRSKSNLFGSLSQDIQGWKTETSLRHSGMRRDNFSDINGSTAVSLPSYWLLDFSVSRPLNANTTWFGRMDNVTNRDYSSTYGYQTLRRSWMTGLKIAI